MSSLERYGGHLLLRRKLLKSDVSGVSLISRRGIRTSNLADQQPQFILNCPFSGCQRTTFMYNLISNFNKEHFTHVGHSFFFSIDNNRL